MTAAIAHRQSPAMRSRPRAQIPSPRALSHPTPTPSCRRRQSRCIDRAWYSILSPSQFHYRYVIHHRHYGPTARIKDSSRHGIEDRRLHGNANATHNNNTTQVRSEANSEHRHIRHIMGCAEMKHEHTKKHISNKQRTNRTSCAPSTLRYCGDARACDGGCDGRTYDGGSALYPGRSPPDDASHGGGGTGPLVALCGADPGPWGGGIIG